MLNANTRIVNRQEDLKQTDLSAEQKRDVSSATQQEESST